MDQNKIKNEVQIQTVIRKLLQYTKGETFRRNIYIFFELLKFSYI